MFYSILIIATVTAIVFANGCEEKWQVMQV